MEINKKIYTINVKGFFDSAKLDSQTGKRFMDVKYGNGVIIFKGTPEEYDEYLNFLVSNEGKLNFKII